MPVFEPTLVLALVVGSATSLVIVSAVVAVVVVRLFRSHRRRMRAKALAAAEQAAAEARARDRRWLWDSLTPRQMEVAVLVAQGKRNLQVAKELNVSEGAVEAHLRNIYEKLNVRSRNEMAITIRELVD